MTRTNDGRSGCITWPTHLNDSGEGGVWVYLLVLAQEYPTEGFSHCHGVENTVSLPFPDVVVSDNREKIYGDMPTYHHDWQPILDPMNTDERMISQRCTQCGTTRSWTREDTSGATYLANEKCPEYESLIMSAGSQVLAAVCLGSSREAWSYGIAHEAESRQRGDDVYWQCRYEDLTEDGKALYKLVQSLYGGRDIALVTYLDT